MTSKTIAEKILSTKSRTNARAGDVVVCDVDLVIGTDASSPMAIDYFCKMGGTTLADASRVVFSLDHYSPPSTPKTAAFHDQVRRFAREHGATVLEVGEGISHQVISELGRALPGMLIIGADSHTVTLGALDLFATGLGSSDIAAAMITGKTWLRVPETVRVVLTGQRPPGVTAKDAGLAMISLLGAEGANYRALEFHGEGVENLALEDRFVLSNLAVEAGAKAAIFPFDDEAEVYLTGRTFDRGTIVESDARARFEREITIDLGGLTPRVSIPHSPNDVVPLTDVADTRIDMVFVGTCTGGRVADYHEALREIERRGGRIASGVQLVITPASREVYIRLLDDGTIARLATLGAVITTPGCGACCGTSGVIPGDGMNVLSTANRNFKARMGNGTASIYLASPAACGAAAATGRITDPRQII